MSLTRIARGALRLFDVWRASAAHEIARPTDDDLDSARAVIDRQPWTFPYLAFLRDKALLFDEERESFVMYGVQGRTCVALGDPVGPVDRAASLIRRFLDRCVDVGHTPVFYEAREAYLQHYRELGLSVVKIEEARVDLTKLTTAGGASSKQRQNVRRLERSGVTFRIVPRTATAPILDQLRAVSDEWLSMKACGEKRFSLGSFSPAYLSRFDIAVMERAGEIIAFANLWAGARQYELATDLIRHRRSAPAETTEALLVHVISWGRRQGYRWFSLGVAPLSGLEESASPWVWNRIASLLYAHGERFYHFRGIRSFKEKFHPLWVPRYLVSRGGPGRTCADVSALIAGGYRHLLPR